MKKRLLSAALALAMVLTLLPMSAFAAAETATAVRYYTQDANPDVTGITADGWYVVTGSGTTASYTLKNDGVVTTARNAATGTWTNGSSGNWYTNTQNAIDSGVYSFVVIGGTNSISSVNNATSLSIDVNGNTVTWGVSDYGNLTSLTVFDTLNTTGSTPALRTGSAFNGAISVGTATAAQGKNFSFTLRNTAMGSTGAVTINHPSTSKVEIDNATVSGAINMIGVNATAQTGSTSSGGSVVVKGNLADVTGLIKLTQNSGSGTVVDVSDGAKASGGIEVSAPSATVKLTNASTGSTPGAVKLSGPGTKLDVQYSKVGAVTLYGSTVKDDASKAAPAVTINGYGASATSIKKGTGQPYPASVSDVADTITGQVKVEVTNNASVTSEISLPMGNITVANSSVGNTGITLERGTLTLGSTTNKTTATKVGAINLGSIEGSAPNQTYGSATLDVVGGNVETGIISEVANNNKTIELKIPADNTNTFAEIKPLASNSKVKNNTIKGGTFGKTVAPASLLDTSLKYELKNTTFTYWVEDDIDKLVAQYVDGTTTVRTTDAPTTGGGTLTLTQGNDVAATTPATVFKLTFLKPSTIKMPSVVGGRAIKEWINSDTKAPIQGGKPVPLNDDAEFNAGALGFNATKVTRAAGSTPGVSASLSGNVITLSGTVTSAGTNTIGIILTTDAGDVKVNASYQPGPNGAAGTLLFMNIVTETDGVMKLADNNTAIELANTNVKYTLRDGGLKLKASDLQLEGNTSSSKAKAVITVTDTKLGNKTALDALSKTLTDIAGNSVDFSGSPAVLEKFGAAIGTISESQVTSYMRTAQDQAYRKTHNNQSPKNDQDRDSTGYNTVTAVLYLDVKVSSYGTAGAVGNMTATLTPSWRVEVKGSGDPIVVKTGASLGALTGEPGKTKIALPVGSSFTLGTLKVHQNNTYVYDQDTPPVTDCIPFTLTHAANTGDGFGTIVLSTNTAPITITRDKDGNPVTTPAPATDVTYGYSTLQAAVDDTINGDTIKVGADITGEQPIIVTGKARKFTVDVTGNATVKNGNGSSLVTVEANGNTWEVQLKQDVAATTTGNITINTATGGSASVSANPATAGSTVTVTLNATAGYTPSGVSVKTASGATVSVSGSGSSYTFTMPSGTVTVTPSFSRTNTNATVSVGGASSGTGTATTNTSGQVAPGTLVTVTTNPGAGQRTMGLTVTGATAIRTGTNTFQFSVPSGYANVVVTPKFDANNGTLYEDVWSTEYYSNPVRWAVERGITNGQSVYRFGTGYNCTREDMVTFLWRAAGSPVMNNVSNPFWDVQAGSYYYNAVLWAVSKGITNGVTANQFGVGQPVTRAQTVTFLYRYNNSPAASTNSGFYDVSSREYYAKAVSWANAKGVTNGTTATTFSPNSYCPREQIVTFLYRDITGNRA